MERTPQSQENTGEVAPTSAAGSEAPTPAAPGDAPPAAPPPRRSRSRRRVVLLGLLLLLVLFLRSAWFGELLRGVVTEQLTALVGEKVEFGAIYVEWVPLGLTLEDLKITSQTPGRSPATLLGVQRLTVSIKLRDLPRRITLPDIELIGPHVDLKLKDGQPQDFRALIERLQGEPTPEGQTPTPEPTRKQGGPQLNLGHIALVDADVHVEDEGTALLVDVQDLSAEAHFQGGLNLDRALLTLRQGRVRVETVDETIQDLTVEVRGEGSKRLEKLWLDTLSVKGKGVALAAKGWTTLPLPEEPPAAPTPAPTPAPAAEEGSPPPPADPLAFLSVLEGLSGALRLDLELDTAAIGRFAPDLPRFSGLAHLKLDAHYTGPDVRGELTLDFEELSITHGETVYRPGTGRLAAGVDRTGADITQLHLKVGEDGDADIVGRLDFFEEWKLSAGLTVQSLELAELLDALSVDSPVMVDLDGTLDVRGTLSPFALFADADLRGRSLHIFDGSWKDLPFEPVFSAPRVALTGPVELNADRVKLPAADLSSDRTQIDVDFSYAFEGRMDLSAELVAVDLTDFSPISGTDLAATGWGSLDLYGPIDTLMLTGHVNLFGLQVLTYPIGDIEADVVMPFSAVHFARQVRQASSRGAAGGLVRRVQQGEGSLAQMAELTARINEHYYGGRLRPDDDALFIFIRDIVGRHGATHFTGSMDVFTDDPLLLKVDVDVEKGSIEDILDIADVDLGEGSPLTGSIQGHVHVEGEPEALTGGSEGLVLTDVRAWGEHFSRVEASVRMDQGNVLLDRAQLRDGDGEAFVSGSYAMDETVALNLSVRGLSLVDLDAVVEADLPLTGRLDAMLTVWGTLDLPHIEGEVAVDGVAYGSLLLGELRARLSTQGQTVSLEGTLGKRVELAAHVDLGGAQPWEALATVTDLPYHFFIGLDDGVPTESSLALAARARGSLSEGGVEVIARLDDLTLVREGTRVQNYGPADLTMSSDGVLHLERFHLVGGSTDLRLTGSVDTAGPLDLVARGSLDLSLLGVLVQDTFQRIEGTLSGPGGSMDLRVGGTLDSLLLGGELALKDMAVRAEAFPQTIDNLSGQLLIEDNVVNLNRLTGTMGGGKVTGGGEIRLGGDLMPYYYNLRVGMNEVVIRYPDYLPPSQVHGELAFQGKVENLLLSGNLVVDRSVYRERINWEKDLLDFRTYRLEDISAPTTEVEPPLFAISVSIKGDNTLYVRNNVANMQMSCDVMLEGDTNDMGVTGEVKLGRGQIYLLDNEMNVVDGTVTFLDRREFNPFLDIRLQTEIRTYTIDYHILGSWVDYQLTASSDAGLSERDINSLLAFGVLADELQGANASAVATPALEFLVGTLGLSQQLEEVVPFKFDRLGFTPVIADNGSTTVRLYGEKELKEDRWFSSFEYSIGEQQDYNFTLEYRVSDTLSFITDLDNGRQVSSSRFPNVGARTRLRWDWE